MPAPNRAAVYLTAAAGLATALAPVVADLDLASTAGLVAGLAAIVTVVYRWLGGWQQYERALYQHELIVAEHTANTEAAARVSGPRPKSINLPR